MTVPRPAAPLARLGALGALALLVGAGAGPALALLAGVAIALVRGNPFAATSRAIAHRLLTWSVIGLGAGMNLAVVGRVGLHGLGYTLVGIAVALGAGTWLGRRLGVRGDTSLLITVGTAICGGSAIAAVASAIDAADHDVSMALVAVFLLNAIALVAFPVIGHQLHLGQDGFGLWSALAIHDTSSVVGAASQYGARALEVATAAKLARALWIVPVTVVVAARRAPGARPRAPQRPWFIAGFLAAAALVTLVPPLRGAGHVVAHGAQRLLAVPLFFIGLGLTRPALRSLGARPLVQAIALWILLASGTLLAVGAGWIGR